MLPADKTKVSLQQNLSIYFQLVEKGMQPVCRYNTFAYALVKGKCNPEFDFFSSFY